MKSGDSGPKAVPLAREEKKKIINSFVHARTSFGLEIGCNFRPLFRKSKGFKIQYLENIDTEGVVARCLKSGKKESLVEPIDFVFDAKKSLSELTGAKKSYDYVLSSHVIEHIPNLIKHFNEIEEILKPGGVYAMLVPDKNYCFDAIRPASTFGDIVEAFLLGSTRPPLSAYIDSSRYAARPVGAAWENIRGGNLERKHRDGDKRIFKTIADGDSPSKWFGHGWVFSPYSFLSIFYDLIRYELLHFDLLDVRPTYSLDFIIVISTKQNSRKGLNRKRAFQRLSELKYAENLPRYSLPDELLLDFGRLDELP